MWDVYYERLAEWESQQSSAGPTETPKPAMTLPTVTVQVSDSEAELDLSGWSHRLADGASTFAVCGVRVSDPQPRVRGGLMKILIDIDAPMPEYLPGDAVDVWFPNPPHVVADACAALGISEDRVISLSGTPTGSGPFLPFGWKVTVKELLTHVVDLTSTAYIQSPFFRMMLERATDATEKVQLSQLDVDRAFRSTFVSTHRPTLGRMLSLFPSTKLTIGGLLSVAAPLRPRRFSVVSAAPLADASRHQVELCVRHHVIDGVPRFVGHCSDPLFHDRCPTWVALRRTPYSSAFLNRNVMVLVGGGSGVAPLVHLARYAKGKSRALAIWTMYGSRTQSEALYANELKRLSNRFALSLSRPAEGRGERVTDTLMDWRGEIAEVVSSGEAGIVCCGPSGLLDSVRRILAGVLSSSQMDKHVLFESWENSGQR